MQIEEEEENVLRAARTVRTCQFRFDLRCRHDDRLRVRTSHLGTRHTSPRDTERERRGATGSS
jgi:hypothetical protein